MVFVRSCYYHAGGRTFRTPLFRDLIMKADIHPKYEEITATCSCGNVIVTRSTLAKNIHLDVCGNCHPFYTGQQKVVDTGGRIDKFKQRFSRFGKK
jgi:large subunit ribosomal protein L31